MPRRALAPPARALAIAHLAGLVLLRALHDPDDLSAWDLISFLNAQCDSLWALLRRPEVHFANPFSFPVYNVGAESAVSAVLHALLGSLSLYWSPVLVLLAYDALFLFLVDRLFRLVLEDERTRTWAWLLLSMSWVTLTFASTQAFDMQAYWPIVLALVGVELVGRGRDGRGALCLAVAFVFISQGHPLSFLLPYYTAAWALFRAVACRRPRGLRSLVAVAVLALVTHLASGGAYLRRISPLNPFDAGNVLADYGGVLHRALLFLRQSFWPVIRVDGVRLGFGPYFVYGAAVVLVMAAVRRRPRGPVGADGMAVAAAAALVTFGYAPAFLNPIVKSQRSVPGDLLLVLVVALGIAALVTRGSLVPARVGLVLAVAALLSDAVYVRSVLAVDHTRNHSPLFDFDLSDGVIRHDMQAAIREMKRQVDSRGATLVIVYPRGYSENLMDPALFHAHFLRHFGRVTGPEVMFPCPYCNARYGCPFPSLLGLECARRCCYEDPRPALERAWRERRPALVWWWKDALEELPAEILDPLRRALPRAPFPAVPLPASVQGWECYEVAPTS